MALVRMQDMLRHAYENKYAVGAFDVVGLEMLQGVIAAAERSRAPVILGLAEPHMEHVDLALLAPAVEMAARRAEVPVAIHYDHGSSVDSVAEGMRLGCNGVMLDGSHLELKENIDITKAAVVMAHACGVPVEAELGYVPDSGDELVYTTVEEARGFVRLTGVDFLAVSIGTVHGRLSGKPKLDYTRLRHINEALGIPLVLHGASGLSDDQFHRLVTNGIAKINYFTGLTDSAAKLMRGNARDDDRGYLSLFNGVTALVEEEAERLMRVWGSAGRAAEVMDRCEPWRSVDHLITFKLPEMDTDELELISRRGRRLLGAIPGVREVLVSEPLLTGSHHQCVWTLRLASEEVIAQLEQHTDYQGLRKRYWQESRATSSVTNYRRSA